MKTLKVFIVLCIILAFSANNVLSQKPESGTFNWPFEFTACYLELGEALTFDLTAEYFINNHNWIEKGYGTATGPVSKDLYTAEYNLNINLDPNVWNGEQSFHWTFPMTIRCNGKLVAVSHISYTYVVNGNGIIVLDRFVSKTLCK